MNKKPTPDILLAVIRAHCLECSGGSRKQVHNCEIKNCRLWPYRKGESRKAGTTRITEGDVYRQMTLFEFAEYKIVSEDRKGEEK